MQTQDNTKTCYRRENRRTRWKTSLWPSKSKLIHWRIKLEYTNNKIPSKPSLPNVLEPPSSCYQQTSRSHVFSSFLVPAIYSIASAKPQLRLLTNPQNFPSSKTLSTLWKSVNCVWVQISSQGMAMGEGMRRRGYNDFSLKMSSSLSKRWVCCVIENLSRVFLSE